MTALDTNAQTVAPTRLPTRMFATLLGLEIDQAPRAFRLLSFIFAVSIGLVVVKAAQSGLLLAAYDDTRAVLPRAFALSAVLLSIASAASASATVKIGPSALAVRGLAIAAATIVGLRGLLAWESHGRVMPLLTYAVIEATSGVLLIQCWSLVSEAVDPRSAKQILPAAGIGASLAWTIGGAAVPALVRAIGPSALLFVSPVAFLAAAAIGSVVTQRDLGKGRAQRSKASVVEAWKSGFSFIMGAPLMRLMMVLSVLALASEQLFDFMLMASAKETLGTQKAISSFFGGYYCVTSLLSLVVLTSISSRLLARLRASESLALTPVLTTLAALAMLVKPGLPAATLLRGSDRVLKQSIWGSAAEQTQTPLPAARRAQARALVRGVVAPLGYALVSGVLGALPAGFDLRWLAIGAIGTTTVMSTLILTSMRKRYVLALRSSIDRRKLRLDDSAENADGSVAENTLDADAIGALRDELSTNDPSRATLAAELLAHARTVPAALALVDATTHASIEVRTHATDGLGDVPLGDASSDEAIAIVEALCDRLQRDPVVAVRRTAARGLRVQLGRLRRGGSSELRERVRKGLNSGRSDTHRDVRAICTVAEAEDDVRSGASPRSALVALLHAPDFETREAALTAVSARLGRDREIRAAVREALADENHDVRMQALRTVTRARIDALLPAVAPLLVDARMAPAAIAALSSWGDDALSVASRALPSLPASRLLDGTADERMSRVSALPSMESRPISRLLEHEGAAAALSVRHAPAIPRAVLEPLLDRELTSIDRLVSCLAGVARDAGVERPPFPAPFTSLGHELSLRLDDGRARVLRLL
ncbi:MAG: hypothetical protein ACHREM_13850, partial [Polyangiales bacterium]